MIAQVRGALSRGSRSLVIAALAIAVILALAATAQLGSVTPAAGNVPLPAASNVLDPTFAAGSSPAPYRPGVVLIGFRGGVSATSQRAIEHEAGGEDATRLGPAIRQVGVHPLLTPLLLKIPSTQVLTAVAALRSDPAVAYAEPDYLMEASATPNDPSFALQWADQNTGQSIPTQGASEELGPPAGGTPGADDRALEAWGLSTGSRSIVIGETDTGVDYNHPDLAANVWSNPGGIGGCAAGTHGYNVLSKTCEPMDDDTFYGGHGTHVAGIMGAVGNNGVGVAGMNWQSTLLPVKWLNSQANGETSGLIEALQWLVAAKQAGVNIRVVNDSATFKGTAFSQALSEEIDTLGANNILFVTAAGNTGDNNDEEKVRRYPCGYDRPNEICVAASNNNDQLPSWANYGPHTVQLAAPGVSIYSTLREGKYGYLSGGSMASPQVAGAAALVLSVKPSLSASEVRADILENVDKLPSLEGKVITGGRLDVCKALPGCVYNPPTTFGKTSVGGSNDTFGSERKRVSRYALPVPGAVTKLSVYLEHTSTSGQQVMKGVIYSDSSGAPGALLGATEALTFKSTEEAGWYDLPLPSPLKLAAGNYWIGVITGPTNSVAAFRYDTLASSRDYNANSYSSGPSNPFGSPTTDGEQASLYATYVTAPLNSVLPTISGTPQQEQALSEAHGTWSPEPTSYAYQWEQCDSSGNNCSAIAGASSQNYVPVAADVGHTIRVVEEASNEGGSSAPAQSEATAKVLPQPPVNISPPTITGAAQQGQTLNEAHGTWTNEPMSYAYQWQQCDATGNGCLPISEATSQTYVPVAGDVGHTLRVQETASNEGGASGPATSGATAVVVPPVPTNISPPTIAGTAQQGQTLSEVQGSWTNSPTSFTYQWLQCDGSGNNCVTISGASSQTYVPVAGDVGHTLEVQETASNEGGSSSPATSSVTAVVEHENATFGKTTVGASSASYAANHKYVNRYALPTAGSVIKLSVYLAPTTTTGQQVLKGVIYADSSGVPSALVGVSEQLTFTSSSSAGWYDLVFSSPVKLAAGSYWIGTLSGAKAKVAGFRWDRVARSRASNLNTYSSGPSNPFGSVTTASVQTSLYATYTPL